MKDQSEDPFTVGAEIGVEASALHDLIDQIEAERDFWRAVGAPGDNLVMVAEPATRLGRWTMTGIRFASGFTWTKCVGAEKAIR